MENTNENLLEMLQEKRTSSGNNFIVKHKFIMMIISVFVSFYGIQKGHFLL